MHQTLKLVKNIFEEWTKEKEIVSIVDKNNQKMGIDENQACGARIIGRHDNGNKKVQLFVMIKTSVNLCRLKQQVRETCVKEIMCTKKKEFSLRTR